MVSPFCRSLISLLAGRERGKLFALCSFDHRLSSVASELQLRCSHYSLVDSTHVQ